MKGSTFADGGNKVSFTHCKVVFEAVTKAYTVTKNSSPITASNPDPCAQSRPLTFTGIEHAVDVEEATAFALKDQPELQAAWFQLIAGDTTVDEALAKQTIRTCATVYEQRGLEPYRYFRNIRRGSVQRAA